MIGSAARRIALACIVGGLMHAMLFLVSLPAGGRQVASAIAPPATRYTTRSPQAGSGEDAESVRVIRSPVVFALPSEMGFSHVLMEHDVQTRKAFAQPQVRSEHFLDVAPSVETVSGNLDSGSLMISAAGRPPALPEAEIQDVRPATGPVRVMLAPRLRERLVGGIVLPAELNREVEKPWMVRATVRVSDQGAVEHAFLEQPLESRDLNREVLRVLYNLRFRPGAPLISTLEVYSPEPPKKEGPK